MPDLNAWETGSSLISNVLNTITANQPFFNVMNYGAKANGVADDTRAIQDAIDACAAAGGGRVVLPGRRFAHRGIVVKNRVALEGAGQHATVLTLLSGSNQHAIRNYVSTNATEANAEWVSVANMRLECNKAGQTSTSHGIHFTVNPEATKATNDITWDTHQRVENVTIYDARDNGFNALGRSEMHLANVYADACGSYGFKPTYDTFMDRCVASNSGLHGFYFDTVSSIRLTNCKSWWNGATDSSNGSGFALNWSSGIAMAGCEAQDNRGSGYMMTNAFTNVLGACVADSNSMNNAGIYPALDIWASHHNVIDMACYERKAYGTNYQLNALRLRAGGASSASNIIRLGHAPGAIGAVGPALHAQSEALTGNHVTINGAVTP